VPALKHIGTLNEKPLHAALKQWYALPGDRVEVPLGGYFVDLVRGELLIEIQTASFGSIRSKLRALTREHRVRLVHPIAVERWVVKQPRRGEPGSRRKSPKRGRLEDVFVELVSFPELLTSGNLSLEVLLVGEEEVRRHDARLRRRRDGWVTEERRLLDVRERHVFHGPADMAALLPPDLEQPFLTSDVAAGLRCPRWRRRWPIACARWARSPSWASAATRSPTPVRTGAPARATSRPPSSGSARRASPARARPQPRSTGRSPASPWPRPSPP
jgi:hypothetical protein